jgi:hypothetical protein
VTSVRGKAIRFLVDHGADEITHPGGTLLAHLVRTAEALQGWGAPRSLILAGLCHAAYGTDGFPTSLIDTSQREQLQAIIGTGAETIVYFYGACDRGAFYPRLGRDDVPCFRDRFTCTEYPPDDAIVRSFVELTIANELDVMSRSPELAARHGASLAELFVRCRPLASSAANTAAATQLRSLAEDDRSNKTRRVPLPGSRHSGPTAAGLIFAFVWLKSTRGAMPYRKLLVVDRAGHTLAALPALRRGGYGFDTRPKFESVWARDDVERFCGAAGLTYAEEEFSDTEALQAAHPGAMGGYQLYAHPWRYTVMGVVGFFVLLIVVLVVVAWVQAVV